MGEYEEEVFIRPPPDEDSLIQHYLHSNCLAYLVRHHSLKNQPSTLGHGCELVSGPSRSVCHTNHALLVNMHLVRLTKSKNDSHDKQENGLSESEVSEHCVSKKIQFRFIISPSFLCQLNS